MFKRKTFKKEEEQRVKVEVTLPPRLPPRPVVTELPCDLYQTIATGTEIRVRFLVVSVRTKPEGAQVTLRPDKPVPTYYMTQRDEFVLDMNADMAFYFFKPGTTVTMVVAGVGTESDHVAV